MSKFKKGDKVKCIDERGANKYIKLGKEYIVKEVKVSTRGGTSLYLEGLSMSSAPSRFELVTPKEEVPTFKVGDKVVCVEANKYSRLEAGKEYTISKVVDDAVYVKGIALGYYPSRFELVKPEEVPTFKVGDKVKCVNAISTIRSLEEGQEYTVREVGVSITGEPFLRLEGLKERYYSTRFELIKEEEEEDTELKLKHFNVEELEARQCAAQMHYSGEELKPFYLEEQVYHSSMGIDWTHVHHQLQTYLTTKEEKEMKETEINVETKTYLNDVEVTEYSDNQLINKIKELEEHIEKLDKMTTKSKKITQLIETHKEGIAKLVELLDSRLDQ